MTIPELLRYRLHNQHISRQIFTDPAELVAWMGAVQAQDYAAAKWAVGLRLKDNTETDIDKALAAGTILRTHIMRPTWHLVTPQDIRWLMELTAPRIKTLSSYYNRQLELDDKVFSKTNQALVKALQGGKHLGRNELVATLEKAKIATGEQRFIHIMMRAELEGIVCSGPRVGKQFTYALFDERVPQSKPLAKDEAIAKLALRYFTSHGPATLKDFVWWSGLTVTDGKAGLALIKEKLCCMKIDAGEYWMGESTKDTKPAAPAAYLLPAYDEYLISYAERSAALELVHNKRVATINGIFNPVIIINSKVAGTWKRIEKKTGIELEMDTFSALSAAKVNAIKSATRRYGKFMELPVKLI